MAKKNNDFFKEKKVWSTVKDDLFACYFKPYVSKILHTYKPLVYVDCFAGKGKFEDGKPGSPIIALDIIEQCKQTTTMESINIESTFIDLNHAKELQENLKGYKDINIISGKYEDQIKNVLKGKEGSNVFLYIDPYGIKALHYTFFEDFANKGFNSLELLINMNSFGFIREACRALGTSFDDDSIFEDLIEYDLSEFTTSEKSIDSLNEIAGGDYWQTIIQEMIMGEIDGYQAEAMFSEQYCQRLMRSFPYVLNMPMRIKKGQRPKYRLIHATKHQDGCLLMVDNICNRWEALQEIQYGGQMQFFVEDFDNQIVDEKDIEEKVRSFCLQYDGWVHLNELLANFFVKYGPICSTGDVKNILKEYEKKNRIDVLRNPKTTPTGRTSTFMAEDKGRTVSVRWKK